MNAIEKHREWIRKYHVGSSHPLLDRVYRLQEKVYIKDSPMGAVYLIHLGDTDVYKIGFSIDPERRLKQLQGKCPLPLRYYLNGGDTIMSHLRQAYIIGLG